MNQEQNQFPLAVMKSPGASRYIGVSGRTLARMIERGQVAYIRIGPRLNLFKRSDLDAFLERHTVRAKGAT